MATNFASIVDKWLDLVKAQTALTAEFLNELLTAVQGSAAGKGVLRFEVPKTLTIGSGPQGNDTILLPGVAKGNIAAPTGFHSATGGAIQGTRLIANEVTPKAFQFEMSNIAADNPAVGIYTGTLLNTSNLDLIAAVIIRVTN